jgi:hypothetical protein
VLDGDEVPWMTKKFAGKGCSGWKMVGVLLMVARGDNSRLCHGDDVSAKGSKKLNRGSGVSSRCCGLARTIDEE